MTQRPTEPAAPEQPPPPQVPGRAASWLFGALIGAVVVGLMASFYFLGKDEGERQTARSDTAPVSRRPDVALVLSALKNGGAGSGAMPQQLYQGAQAKQVADDVAAASGGG